VRGEEIREREGWASRLERRPAPTPPRFLPATPPLPPLVDPPRALASAFRPLAGPYSSADPSAAATRMRSLAAAGVNGVLIPCRAPTLRTVGGLMETVPVRDATNGTALRVSTTAATAAGLAVGFLSRPYPGRTARTVRDDFLHCVEQARAARGGATTPPPVFLVRGAASVPCRHWRFLLTPGSAHSVRTPSNPLSGAWMADWAGSGDGDALAACGFDGGATPPADDDPEPAVGVPWGARPQQWAGMRAATAARGVALVATVSPGADATATRPWDRARVRARQGGARYVRGWRAAAAAGVDAVLIDSFNGWTGGTQIEEAGGSGAPCAPVRTPTSTAPGPECAPGGQAYGGGGGAETAAAVGAAGVPRLYMALTAVEASRAARTPPRSSAPVQLQSAEDRVRSWRGHAGDAEVDEDDDPTP